MREVKARVVGGREAAPFADQEAKAKRFECEHVCWDPKDGELCLRRAKPGETLVEARSDSDVQIDRLTWV
ncbi:MAG: hypothetical protein GY784_18910 [Gammaproteobacteria bacterium]|nr:hypothetical protein [Gammaproteobacteria bacterium]